MNENWLTQNMNAMFAMKDMGLCPSCEVGVHETDFAAMDDLYLQEFHISGLCIECQDRIFADPDDEE